MNDWLPTGRTVYAYLPQLRQSRHLGNVELGWIGERGNTLAVRGTCDGRRYVVPLALVSRDGQTALVRKLKEAGA